jgi:hypothetical protein
MTAAPPEGALPAFRITLLQVSAMSRHAMIEPLEGRQLMSFAKPDAGFGVAGTALAGPRRVSAAATDRIVALADGGSVVRLGDHQFRRFDARGKPVMSYGGGDGALQLDSNNRMNAVAIDPRTGRIAFVAYVGIFGARTLDVYSPGGDLEQTVSSDRLEALGVANTSMMSFDRKGGLLLASSERVARLVTRTGELDPAFGVNGIVPLGGTAGNGYGLRAMTVGPDGSITLIRTSTLTSADTFEYFLDLDRLQANGQRDARFGTSGAARVLAGNGARNADGDRATSSTTIYNAAAAPDGSIYLFQERFDQLSGPGLQVITRRYELQQIRDNGTLARPIDLTGHMRSAKSGQYRVLVDTAGRIYAASGAEVVRLDARRRFDLSFNGETGSAAVTSPLVIGDAAIDAAGRVLLLGRSNDFNGTTVADAPPTIRAISGVTESLGSPARRATLLPDGTLDISGSSKADDVRLRRFGAQLRVIINGATQRIDLTRVAGILIHTGAGNDNVRVDANIRGVRIQGGSGDDRLTGGDGEDFIDGGDGNDFIDGRRGDDILRGGAGNDTIRGSEENDRLDAGAGDDLLFGSDEAGTEDGRLGFNTLLGGAGADRLVATNHRPELGRGRIDLLADVQAEDLLA